MNKAELRDRMADGSLSRRQVSKLLAGAGLAMVMVPLAGRRSRAAGDVTFFTWTGYDDPGFFL